MKEVSQSFSQPVQVIRLFKKQLRFGKEDKAGFDLRAFHAQESAGCSGGFVEEGKLFLDGSLLGESEEVQGSDLLVMVDEADSAKRSALHFLKTSSANRLEIFKIFGKDPIELHLEWSYFHVGDPSRDHMKLCYLVPGKAYEIRINGKTDFSLTGRRPRHYLEQIFVVEHLGIFSEYTPISDSKKIHSNKLPELRKVIDLRKPLW
jgi:hypothetical protein